MRDTLISGLVGAASEASAHLAGAPWWVGLAAMFGMRLLLLASQLMSYREVHRLARLPNAGCVKGHDGIEWEASSVPKEPEPDKDWSPKRRRWLQRKIPPDS